MVSLMDLFTTQTQDVTSIPIATTTGNWVVVSHLGPVPDLRKNDYLMVVTETPITNPQTYTVTVFSQVLQSSAPGVTTGGIILGPAGENLSLDRHHMLISRATPLVVTDPTKPYFNVMAYGFNATAGGADTLSVDNLPELALLTVMRIRPYG